MSSLDKDAWNTHDGMTGHVCKSAVSYDSAAPAAAAREKGGLTPMLVPPRGIAQSQIPLVLGDRVLMAWYSLARQVFEFCANNLEEVCLSDVDCACRQFR